MSRVVIRELAQQLFDAASRGDAAAVGALLASPRAARAVNGCRGVAHPPLLIAAGSGYLEVCRLLLGAGADVNIVDERRAALAYAASRGHLEVIRLLLAAGAAVDQHSVDGSEETALLGAAGSGYLPIVQALLAAGTDVQARTARGSSPLYLASQNGHADCVRALLRAGADVS